VCYGTLLVSVLTAGGYKVCFRINLGGVKGSVYMIDPVQAAIGIVVLLIVVGALLYLFYSRTNAVEKTGYGALIMLAIVSIFIPVLWIMETNAEAMAKVQQHTVSVQSGAALYAQYCFQCHGLKGQGLSGPKINGNTAVNNLSDTDLLRIISGGIADPTDPSKFLMPAWSDQFGGPLDSNQIQYLFELVRSADPAYLQKNGYPSGASANGFNQVGPILQASQPSTYQTAVAQESAGKFGAPKDLSSQKAVTINIIQPPTGATCSPACFEFPNVKVKVGSTITWVNKSTTAHTVTAIQGENPSSPAPASQIFDSGTTHLIQPGQSFTYTVTTAAYNFNKDHAVVYFCEIHPVMVAELTIVP
jgi:plastocyanin/mono/diheme cytochrome c family protein